jgi:hypothetical protein
MFNTINMTTSAIPKCKTCGQTLPFRKADGTFDRRAYMAAWMRDKRAKDKLEKKAK